MYHKLPPNLTMSKYSFKLCICVQVFSQKIKNQNSFTIVIDNVKKPHASYSFIIHALKPANLPNNHAKFINKKGIVKIYFLGGLELCPDRLILFHSTDTKLYSSQSMWIFWFNNFLWRCLCGFRQLELQTSQYLPSILLLLVEFF